MKPVVSHGTGLIYFFNFYFFAGMHPEAKINCKEN